MKHKKKIVKEILPTQAENRIGANNNMHNCNPKAMSKSGRNK